MHWLGVHVAPPLPEPPPLLPEVPPLDEPLPLEPPPRPLAMSARTVRGPVRSPRLTRLLQFTQVLFYLGVTTTQHPTIDKTYPYECRTIHKRH